MASLHGGTTPTFYHSQGTVISSFRNQNAGQVMSSIEVPELSETKMCSICLYMDG